MAGGVALNCIANSKILENRIVKEIYVQSASNDAGTAIGAALEASFILEKDHSFDKISHTYFGPEYSNEEIKEVLDSYRINYRRFRNISKKCAELIHKGEIVAWFQGKMEMGPRALGARSILMDPRKAENKDIMNNRVKYRESFRPFCPSIIDEAKDEYFINAESDPFMIISCNVRKQKIKEIPAVVHVDGTARPQIVTKERNAIFYKLLKSFENLTKVPVLLNTSFNIKGEPIVCTPSDAIKCFYDTGIDYLAIEDFLISK